MRYTVIKNAEVIFADRIKTSSILLENDKIVDCDFKGEIPKECNVIDAKGNYLSPGFIDIHVHGGGGYDFMDCTDEAFKAISEIHLKNGATTIIPTAVSAEFSSIISFIDTFKKCKYSNLYGIHLEGPFISVNQKGAHKEHLLHSPSKEEMESLLDVGKNVIKRITAAPELNGMKEFSKKMIDNGVVMSLGHSDATSDIALEAFRWGFSHITHLYSATPSVRKINQVVKAGVLEAAYLDDNVTVELIGDGKHAAVDAMKLAYKIKGVDKIAITSDALRPAGTDVQESWLGEKIPENRVIIEDGVAKLPDRSFFAGSIATASVLLKKGVTHYGMSLLDTVTMLTRTPARIMKLDDRGKIEKDMLADLVIFDKKLNIIDVIKSGKICKCN